MYQKTNSSAVYLKAAYVSEVCDAFGDLRVEFRPENNPLERTNLSVELRRVLRDSAFAEWSVMSSQRGVGMFKSCPQANRWISKKEDLTESGWRTRIMARCNAVPVRTPRSLQIPFQDQLCRRCGRKPKTLGHVLGECEHNDLLINGRHNDIVRTMRDALQEKNFHVGYEIRCQKSDETSRRVDSMVIWPGRQKALILDPSIRLERGDADAAFVEKRSVYDNVIPWFEREFRLPVGSITVHGL